MQNKEKKFLIYILLIAFILLLVALRDYIVAVFSGLILAYIFFPVYSKINKGLKKDYLSAGLTLILSIIIIIIPLILISSILVIQASYFINKIEIKDFVEQLEIARGLPVAGQINEFVQSPQTINFLKNLIKEILTFLTKSIPSFITYVSNFVLKLFITFIVMFFMLIDKGRSVKILESLTPLSRQNKQKLRNKSKSVVRTVIYGQVLVALVQGAIGGIGFFIFGLEGAVLWGFIMAVFSIIPIIGAFLVWVPASVYLMASGSLAAGIGLFAYGAIIVSYSDNILRMKILSSIGRIHPLITFFGVLIGLTYFGILGLIIGPLLLALFVNLIQITYDEKR